MSSSQNSHSYLFIPYPQPILLKYLLLLALLLLIPVNSATAQIEGDSLFSSISDILADFENFIVRILENTARIDSTNSTVQEFVSAVVVVSGSTTTTATGLFTDFDNRITINTSSLSTVSSQTMDLEILSRQLFALSDPTSTTSPCGKPLSSWNVILGTTENDVIFGTSGDDFIDGSNGDDIINAGDGDDCVYGGIGKDVINLGNGDDIGIGNFGDDTIIGGPGLDLALGGNNNDTCDAEHVIECE